MQKINKSAFFCLAISLTLASSAAWSDSTDGTSTEADEAKQTATPAVESSQRSSKRKVYEGNVKGTALLTEEGIGRIGEAANEIQNSALKIIKESTRKDTIVVHGPNALPNGVILQPIGGAGGVMQFGEMPIRRDKLEKYVNLSDLQLKALQSYIDALILPEGASEAAAVCSKMRDTMQSAVGHFDKLKELSTARRLVNTKIAREALGMHDEIGRLNQYRSQLAALVVATETPAADSSK